MCRLIYGAIAATEKVMAMIPQLILMLTEILVITKVSIGC